MSRFDEYTRKNKKIVCIDSDGCAMDTMNIKHIRCFGPCMVKEWDLYEWEKEILDRWNEINLYSMTRGINRFKGLAMMLCEVDEKYRPIEGIKALKTWAEEAPELSNSAVEKMLSVDDIFKKTLNWSKAVNVSIGELPKEEIKPFAGVKEAFEKIHETCDIAVVSSANREAVVAEWERFGLLPYVDILCAQDMGSKAFCIGEILRKGFSAKDVLMCGDAPGDEAAAFENRVLYYPILVNHEEESWKRLKEESLDIFLSDNYEGSYQKKMSDEFRENLK